MWPLAWITFLIVFIEVQSLPVNITNTGTHDCSLCKPGYFVLSKCTSDKDTVCRLCPEGTFTHQFNLANMCYPCSKCGSSLFELKHCSRSADVFCESCASKNHKHLKTYLEFCLGYDADVANIQADGTFVNGHEDKVSLGSGSKLDTSKHKETETNAIAALDTNEGEPLDSVLTLPQEEAAEEELLLVFSTRVPSSGDNAIYEYKGLSLSGDNNFEGSGFEGSGADVYIKTTPLLEELPSSGEGEIIVDVNGEINDTVVDTVVVLRTNRLRTFSPEGDGDGDEEVVLIPPNDASVEKGRELDKIHTAAVDNRKRAAIIVGVALGSVAFFTIGFLVSRYYRRKRSFTINQKVPSGADNINGSKEALEFQDMSNSPRIYTGPNMANKNGKYTQVMAEEIAKEDIYAVPLKKEQRPRSSENDKHVNGIDKMKYMDETDAEEKGESANLLANDNENGVNENQSLLSDVVLDRLEQRLSPIEEEEKAPMLPKS